MAVDGADAVYCPSLLPARCSKTPCQVGGVDSCGPFIPQGHLALRAPRSLL